MKKVTFSGEVSSAYGKELPTPVKFAGEFDSFEKIEEVPTADRLTPEDELQVLNAKRKAAARAKATTDALTAAGIEKPSQEDPAVIKANMVKLFVKLYKVSEDTAAKMVEAAGSMAGAQQ